MHQSNFDIISSFPDFHEQSFCIEKYNDRFNEKNIIINARSRSVHYAKHWGPLSLKFAFNGTEHYNINNCIYAVNDANFLIVNHGNYYSSFIESDTEVESFTINFTPALVADVLSALGQTDQYFLDNFNYTNARFECCEKLYSRDALISPLVFQLKKLVVSPTKNKNGIDELYILLAERLFILQKQLQGEIAEVPVLRVSTKKELYKRLNRAKDYIDSCFYKNLTIAELANISFLNQTYFLRQFKNYFKITPRQYIIAKRMNVARDLLISGQDISVTDICLRVGYNDLSSFSKLFKQFYRQSPENFHKRLNQPHDN